MPRGAAGQLPTFQEQHILPSEPGKVIGNTASNDPTTHYHHLSLGRQSFRHVENLSQRSPAGVEIDTQSPEDSDFAG
jgi:hypothetical protein